MAFRPKPTLTSSHRYRRMEENMATPSSPLPTGLQVAAPTVLAPSVRPQVAPDGGDSKWSSRCPKWCRLACKSGPQVAPAIKTSRLQDLKTATRQDFKTSTSRHQPQDSTPQGVPHSIGRRDREGLNLKPSRSASQHREAGQGGSQPQAIKSWQARFDLQHFK